MALGCLSVEIERLRPKQTILGAARVLTTREPWKSFLSEGGDDAVEALRQAYYVAKKNPDTIRAKEMFRGYEASGNLAGWESYVDDYVKQN